jgi:hypothetical protein
MDSCCLLYISHYSKILNNIHYFNLIQLNVHPTNTNNIAWSYCKYFILSNLIYILLLFIMYYAPSFKNKNPI